MNKFYIVIVIIILYPWFGMNINIVSKEDNSYRATIGDIH